MFTVQTVQRVRICCSYCQSSWGQVYMHTVDNFFLLLLEVAVILLRHLNTHATFPREDCDNQNLEIELQ